MDFPNRSPDINHLSYADDTILFCFGDQGPIKKIMTVLGDYEMVFGQIVNRDKSFFYLNEKTPLAFG